MKHGDLKLDLFSNSALDAFIEFYVLTNFIVCLFCVLLYDFHNKINKNKPISKVQIIKQSPCGCTTIS